LDGLVITPKTESYVSITSIDGDKWFVSQYSKIDGLTLNVEGSVVLNGGENGGLCITPTLKDELDKMSARIDTIIKAISTAAFGSQDGGKVLQKNMKEILGGIKDENKEDFKNIENKKIKH
jgi:hypothetical protein